MFKSKYKKYMIYVRSEYIKCMNDRKYFYTWMIYDLDFIWYKMWQLCMQKWCLSNLQSLVLAQFSYGMCSPGCGKMHDMQNWLNDILPPLTLEWDFNYMQNINS